MRAALTATVVSAAKVVVEAAQASSSAGSARAQRKDEAIAFKYFSC
jgi:indole-3-glycerol phosphate synthase